jgi:serine/threonine-protein kinase
LGRKAAAFKAFDTWLQRPVAVKVLSKSMGEEADQILLREARAVARLNHPNIVSVYNCVEYRDRLYLVREFVEGLNLRDRLDQLESGQLLAPSQVLAISEGILTALAYVHERGILHRYLHPRNIILSNHELKIMNFGLVDTPEEDWSLSDASYMAPEQLAKEQPTERADLYAFGVILYELVTGRMPFAADTVKQLIRLRMYHDPVPVCELNPNVPKSLEQIILNLLSQSPGHRYPSAAMVLDALSQVETWVNRALHKDHKEAV